MTTFKVLRFVTNSVVREEPALVGEHGFYNLALEDVLSHADGDTLVPMNAPDVALLRGYNTRQAWELRDYESDEKRAILAIGEVRDDEVPSATAAAQT